jgi:putative transposase
VLKQLQRQGRLVGETRVRRVLKVMGHTVKVGRVRVRTTDSSHPHWRYPNRLKRLKPKYPHHVWVADITYLRLAWRFIYLAAILDAYTRAVRGWALSRTIDEDLTLAALEMALNHGVPRIFHSDQGSQYTCAGRIARPFGIFVWRKMEYNGHLCSRRSGKGQTCNGSCQVLSSVG